MVDPKDKKKKSEEDTDHTDERGGGEDDVFTEKDFYNLLDKAIKPPKDEDEK